MPVAYCRTSNVNGTIVISETAAEMIPMTYKLCRLKERNSYVDVVLRSQRVTEAKTIFTTVPVTGFDRVKKRYISSNEDTSGKAVQTQ